MRDRTLNKQCALAGLRESSSGAENSQQKEHPFDWTHEDPATHGRRFFSRPNLTLLLADPRYPYSIQEGVSIGLPPFPARGYSLCMLVKHRLP